MNNAQVLRAGMLLGALSALPGLAAPTDGPEVSPVEWLLAQVRTGESTNKYDLVQQSLYRLEKIDPDNPQVLAARLRLALHQGDIPGAQLLLDQLKKVAPDSAETRESAVGLALTSSDGRQQLQQARLLATSGRLTEAKSAYDALFNGVFPDPNTALEYWRLLARLPGQEDRAYQQLQALEQRYPGNIGVELQIARMAFTQQQPEKAIAQLKKLANSNGGRAAAADLWLQQIRDQPVSDNSVAQLKAYLAVFTEGDAYQQGTEALSKQQTMLADPAYRERTRALALVDAGNVNNAMVTLDRALKANPDDPELMGAMGQTQARAGHREAAIIWLERAIKAGQQSTLIGKWQALLQSNRYWLAIEQGDKALAQQDIEGAEQYYRAAQKYDSSDSYALIGLGDVAMARKDTAAAEQFWQNARRLDGTNITAVRRLAGLYQAASPARELEFINTLPVAQQRALADTIRTLRSDSLRAEADALTQQARWSQAADKYRQARELAPDDVWLSYRLAGALRNSGDVPQANAVMRAVLQQHPQDATALYATALWFSGNDNDSEAMATLHRLPDAQWSSDMRQLADRLNQNQIFAQAEALRAAGQEQAAVTLLHQQPVSSRRDLTLADWALARGDAQQALTSYQQVLSREPGNGDAALGRIDALVALQRISEARLALAQQPPVQATVKADRRAALAWQAVGETTRAAVLFTDLKQRAASLPPSQDKALVFRDAARLERVQQQPEQALADYRQAMTASGMDSSGNISRATRSDPQDDWLKRSLRSDTADLYRQQQTTLTVQQDYSRNSGTGGISDFTAHTTMLQAEHPFASGRGFFRLDQVDVSAGTFTTRNGSFDEQFGSCDDANSGGCNSQTHQRDKGTALAAGWHNAIWSADLGTTPLGFEVTNWTGGLSWKTDVKQLGVTLTASRRPIASSLLSYAGTRDPAASGGKSWGGVVATGGSIGLSYDQGGAHGVWGDISAHQITGKNVADNSRERLMGGYYYKLINSDNRRATVGLNSMLWHYQKDLSDYTFGQGGYYSPQQYLSFAVPVTWRQRTENWSFDLGGSVSWSHSKTDAQQRYPVNPGFALASNPSSASSAGGGIGYTLQAVVERRLTSGWFVGAGIDIQQAKDYTPSHGLLYVRYAAGGWEGDLDMPPQPLVPYADFK
ncbi:cellulose synthase complex outer membrane protein BcsC [Pantoea sp. WMus005]|uniref:cellulose synthase complex outer membrane protein BcsC n=1 Tax=Pantoea sp. WMus005 TaxID=2750734 RepID=UPI0015D044B3|nr:cellulose synthase complex outer membrane protein BcsC [Pantoea sp. WMus005]NYS31850.1 cellulose biosynthesis protein BcsC [Pantoea sp. WMus005]